MMLLRTAQYIGRAALRASGVRSRLISVQGATLSLYEGEGTGTLAPIIFLHGLGGAAVSFGRLMLALRPYVSRVSALDLPGHGFSSAPSGPLTVALLNRAVTEALDTLTHQPTLLLGNSLGGALATRYALARPSRICGLILVSPAGGGVDDGDIEALRSLFLVNTLRDVRALCERLFVQPPWFLPLVAPEILRSLKRGPLRDFVASWRRSDMLSGPELTSLAVPTLLLHGKRDRVLSPAHLAYWREHLPPSAIVEEPERFGHSPHFDLARDLAERVLAFARRVSS